MLDPDERSSLMASLAEFRLKLADDIRRARSLRPMPDEARVALTDVHAAVLDARTAGIIGIAVRAEVVIIEDHGGAWSWAIVITSTGPRGGRALRFLSMRWPCQFAAAAAEAAA